MTTEATRSRWQRLSIIGLCETHVDCVNRTAPVVSEPTPYKMLRTTNVRDGYVDTVNVRYVTDETYQRWTRRLVPKRGDIILTREAPLGGVGKLRTDDLVFLGQRLYQFRPDSQKLDADFLLYSLLGSDLQSQIKAFGSGSTVEHMRLEDIPSLELNVPSLAVQRRIGRILSAYDELIENSQRRIKILETMARALYREWFVHFRFPGHEHHPCVPSPLGEIPQGWEEKRIGDTFHAVLGGTPSRARSEFWDGGTIPWINSGKVNDLRITEASELITPLALEKSAAKLMPKGTTVLAITGATLGQVSYLEIDTAANQSVVGIIDPSSMRSEWIYLTMSERIQAIIKHASGGAQQHINKEIVSDVQVALPPDSLAKDFKGLVAPMFRELATLLFQVQNLRRTRDLLLPRLLSGQIDIEVA